MNSLYQRRASTGIEEGFKNYRLDHILLGGHRLTLRPSLDEYPYLEVRVHKLSGRVLVTSHADRETLNCSLVEAAKSGISAF